MPSLWNTLHVLVQEVQLRMIRADKAIKGIPIFPAQTVSSPRTPRAWLQEGTPLRTEGSWMIPCGGTRFPGVYPTSTEGAR